MKSKRRTAKNTKLKKTFSLSAESVEFLKRLARKYRSDSEALDALIREKRLMAEKRRIDAAVTAYYDSLTKAEQEEDRSWGAFAESQSSSE